MTEHTPGPFCIKCGEVNGEVFRLREVNADLLAALQRLRGEALHGDYVPSAYIIDVVRAAIAKATGGA